MIVRSESNRRVKQLLVSYNQATDKSSEARVNERADQLMCARCAMCDSSGWWREPQPCFLAGPGRRGDGAGPATRIVSIHE